MRKRALLAAGLLAALAVPRRTAGVRGSPVPVLDDPPPLLTPAPVPAEPPGRRGAADVMRRSVRAALAANLTDIAASLAYYAFLAIPATLLVAVGVFGLLAEPDTIQGLLERLDGVVPADAITLIDDTLTRVTEGSGSGASLAIVGLLLAAWTSSGAMSALMRGLNRVHGYQESRSFVRQRLTALALLGWCLLAVVVSFALLVLGAPLSSALGDALDAETLVSRLWWGAQWPILAAALLLAVVGILRLGPCGTRHDRRAEMIGAGVAVAIWIAASGLFGVYVSRFGNYGAAWGSLSAVIVLLTWLWLTAVALLAGAQVEAEVVRGAPR